MSYPIGMRLVRRTRDGFTLVEIMIAIGLSSVVALGVATIMLQLNKTSRQANIVSNARLMKQNFVEMVSNDQAWSNTLADKDNKSFKCLVDGSDCSKTLPNGPDAKPNAFALRTPADAVFYNGLDATNGLTEGGTNCSGFPSAGCPFQMQLSWTPLCPKEGPCILPELLVVGNLVYNSPGNPIVYNPENYSFKIFRKALPQSSAATNTAAASAVNASADLTQSTAVTLCRMLKDSPNPTQAIEQVTAQMKGTGINPEAIQLYITQIQQACN